MRPQALLLVDMSLKFLLIYNSSPRPPHIWKPHFSLFKVPFVSWWIWVIYPADCFTFWLIASLWCHLTCPSVPCVSWKLTVRSRGLIRDTFDFWLAAVVEGGVHALLHHVLTSGRLSLKNVRIDQWLTLPLLMNFLPPSVSIALRTCFAQPVSWEHWSYRTARSDGKCTDLEHWAQIGGFISLHLSFLDCEVGLILGALRTNPWGKRLVHSVNMQHYVLPVYRLT